MSGRFQHITVPRCLKNNLKISTYYFNVKKVSATPRINALTKIIFSETFSLVNLVYIRLPSGSWVGYLKIFFE